MLMSIRGGGINRDRMRNDWTAPHLRLIQMHAVSHVPFSRPVFTLSLSLLTPHSSAPLLCRRTSRTTPKPRLRWASSAPAPSSSCSFTRWISCPRSRERACSLSAARPCTRARGTSPRLRSRRVFGTKLCTRRGPASCTRSFPTSRYEKLVTSRRRTRLTVTAAAS